MHEKLRSVRRVACESSYCEKLRYDACSLRVRRLRDAATYALWHSQVSKLLPKKTYVKQAAYRLKIRCYLLVASAARRAQAKAASVATATRREHTQRA